MNNKIPLSDLKTGQSGIIESIRDSRLSAELLRFGITGNTEVEALMFSPIGNTRAYFFSSFIIALRNEDADNIIIRTVSGGVGSE